MFSKRNKRVRKQDCPFEWILARNKRSDRRLAVIGEQIILSSLRHPSLNIIFTINRWAHFVAMLEDINEAAHLRPLERKATGRRRVSFRKNLDDGIYITAHYRKHIIDFRKHFAIYGQSNYSVFSSRNGISMEDEWIDLFQNVIPDIHRHYPVFANAQPRCGCLLYGNDSDMNNHLGWKACTVCYPFGHYSDYEDMPSGCDHDYIRRNLNIMLDASL